MYHYINTCTKALGPKGLACTSKCNLIHTCICKYNNIIYIYI